MLVNFFKAFGGFGVIGLAAIETKLWYVSGQDLLAFL